MGRGRAKAKQTKVARQLKYSSGGTDLERLQRELAESRGEYVPPSDDGELDEADDEYVDPYAADDDEDEPAL